MQFVLVDLQYEESSYSTLIKCNFCNLTFWMPGVVAPFAPPPLHATEAVTKRNFPKRHFKN